jgi:hypothetical protein
MTMLAFIYFHNYIFLKTLKSPNCERSTILCLKPLLFIILNSIIINSNFIQPCDNDTKMLSELLRTKAITDCNTCWLSITLQGRAPSYFYTPIEYAWNPAIERSIMNRQLKKLFEWNRPWDSNSGIHTFSPRPTWEWYPEVIFLITRMSQDDINKPFIYIY